MYSVVRLLCSPSRSCHQSDMSLADSFLADLEDIEEIEAVLPLKAEEDTVPVFPTLLNDQSFQDYISRVGALASMTASSLNRSSEYFILISKSNNVIPQIDAEIFNIYKYVAEIYSRRFPELEQVVLMPIDYIRVVERLVKSGDVASADLADFLPNHLIVAITVTSSTSSGGPALSERDLTIIRSRTETGISLNACKDRILDFLKSRTPLFAPNLAALLGPMLAAQLVASAGGIENLATMPSQNIEAVGAHRQSQGGLSSAGQQARLSLVSRSDLVSGTSGDVRKRAIRLVLGKTAIAARVDQFNREDKLGQTGSRLREEIEEALRKASAPPPARAIKPLPLPEDFKPKTTKRGGKRARMWKEKYGVTEAQKRANRIAFGEGTGDVGEESRGMLDVETGGGRIRKTKIKESRILSQAAAKMYTGNSSDSAVVSLALSQGGIHLAAAPIAPRPVAKRDLFGNHVGFGGQNN